MWAEDEVKDVLHSSVLLFARSLAWTECISLFIVDKGIRSLFIEWFVKTSMSVDVVLVAVLLSLLSLFCACV
jgi:hypothetical protein